MKTVQMTQHARVRIENRLNGLTSVAEVMGKVEKVIGRLNSGRNWIMIKKIQYTERYDPDVKPDGIARGDMILALVENWKLETVMIRKSWSAQVGEYRKIIH